MEGVCSPFPPWSIAFYSVTARAGLYLRSQQEHHTVLEISVNMLDLKITGVLLGPLGIPCRTPAKERLCSSGARED